ncbi:hypothetical protein COO60DRAFT_1533787 [Scenedesmus sp. NREL 46B-D3]|nr:hypothetical protein COO60DRAFT_1533787 [Scenedesmus sp. NREL 46B-D3]
MYVAAAAGPCACAASSALCFGGACVAEGCQQAVFKRLAAVLALTGCFLYACCNMYASAFCCLGPLVHLGHLVLSVYTLGSCTNLYSRHAVVDRSVWVCWYWRVVTGLCPRVALDLCSDAVRSAACCCRLCLRGALAMYSLLSGCSRRQLFTLCYVCGERVAVPCAFVASSVQEHPAFGSGRLPCGEAAALHRDWCRCKC